MQVEHQRVGHCYEARDYIVPHKSVRWPDKLWGISHLNPQQAFYGDVTPPVAHNGTKDLEWASSISGLNVLRQSPVMLTYPTNLSCLAASSGSRECFGVRR